jgi:parallel beta helix pectate lyase-like protein
MAAVVAIALAVPAVAGTREPVSGRRVLHVGPGGSIQAAVDRARPGDTVQLSPGVYRQSVLIRTNGVRLVGAGPDATFLRAPAELPDTLCTRFSGGSGVCVFPPDLRPDGAFERRVSNVTIAGIAFRGWPSMGVMALGARNLVLAHNAATDVGAYGFAWFDTIGGAIRYNVARSGGEAGIYLGDSQPANAVVEHNVATGSLYGVFIRHARGVTLEHNVLRGNCQGVIVLDDGQPKGAGDSTIRYNVVVSNNRSCPGDDEAPTLEGGGIALAGATDTTVAWNIVRNNDGAEINSGGIVLLSVAELTGGADASGNTIERNTLIGNAPADIRWDGLGTGNTFQGNDCGSSDPTGLCS